MSQKAYKAPKDIFPEPAERFRSPVEQLPSSRDAEFWGDGEKQSVNLAQLDTPRMDTHSFDWSGPYAMCTTCPHAHTMPGVTPLTHVIRSGKILKK